MTVELRVQILESIRGDDVFIIQATNPPAENLLELLFLIRAARLASAGRITAVIPYYGYARQDKKDEPRVPLAAELIAEEIVDAGAERVVVVELHSGQIQAFLKESLLTIFLRALF